MDKIYYFDNAATTRVSPEVMEEISEYFTENYFNPSSIYTPAQKCKEVVEKARGRVAAVFNADPKEIYFTSGGSEADNWAIKGIAEAYSGKGKHIITSAIEHHAVLHTCEYLESKGYEVTYLPVNKEGFISLEDLKAAIRPDTILITIMFANNEIGTIQPIGEIGKIAKENGIIFHTDAVQAAGHIPIDVKALNIDLMSMSGHKIYAPKGVGALYIRKGIKIKNLIHGGQQERGRRATTENVPGIVGIGKAMEDAVSHMTEEAERQQKIRDKIIDAITSKVDHCWLNGSRENRLPGNINISFEFIEGESILLLLDMNGICGSSGSACTSGSLDPSHVLLAIGLPHEKAHGSLRLTIGRFNTEEEADYVIKKIPPIIERLRQMSPLYAEFIKSENKEK
ncbi:MAG: cysteine desulfurase NifS [Clostridiales bacterium]|nr:cysteine desulfurase NifS [Clostridiales bacterium]